MRVLQKRQTVENLLPHGVFLEYTIFYKTLHKVSVLRCETLLPLLMSLSPDLRHFVKNLLLVVGIHQRWNLERCERVQVQVHFLLRFRVPDDQMSNNHAADAFKHVSERERDLEFEAAFEILSHILILDHLVVDSVHTGHFYFTHSSKDGHDKEDGHIRSMQTSCSLIRHCLVESLYKRTYSANATHINRYRAQYDEQEGQNGELEVDEPKAEYQRDYDQVAEVENPEILLDLPFFNLVSFKHLGDTGTRLILLKKFLMFF